MFPIIIIIFILLFTSLILIACKCNAIQDLYKGGYVEPRDTDIIRNKLFFNYNKHDELIYNLIKGENNILVNFDDIKEKIRKDNEKFSLVRTSTHIGQLKLFLSELEFLTEFLPKHDTNNIVLYAGSGPGNKIYYLHTLFPNIKFILVDPAEHLIYYPDGNHYESKMAKNIVYLDCKNRKNKYNIRKRLINFYDGKDVIKIEKENQKTMADFSKYYNSKNLINFIKDSDYTFYIIEDYFKNELADLFSGLDCLFISDIRTQISEMVPLLEKLNKQQVKQPKMRDSEDFPTDLDICWNNAMHLNWLQRLRPKVAMLKFRATWFIQDLDEFNYYAKLEPYAADFAEAKKNGIDFVADYNNKICRFLDNNKIYLQAFPGIISSESRHVCTDYKKIKEYDYLDYDQKYYYYNWIYRQFAFIQHDCIDKKLGLDGCNDCALMAKIFRDYLEKYHFKTDSANVIKKISELLRIIKRTLKTDFHGSFLQPYKNINAIIQKQSFFIVYDFYNTYKNDLGKYIM